MDRATLPPVPAVISISGGFWLNGTDLTVPAALR